VEFSVLNFFFRPPLELQFIVYAICGYGNTSEIALFFTPRYQILVLLTLVEGALQVVLVYFEVLIHTDEAFEGTIEAEELLIHNHMLIIIVPVKVVNLAHRTNYQRQFLVHDITIPVYIQP